MSTPRSSPYPESPDSEPLRAALHQLRLKLLDLTGRNRLLNYKHTIGKSLQSVQGDPVDVYAKLADGKSTIQIKGLPEPSRADHVIRNGRWVRPDPKDWAERRGIPTSYDLPARNASPQEGQFRALMYPDDLAKHCRKIEREAVLAIEETGANMLHLVLGFLDFPDQKDSDRIFSAPLLSVPVSMLKKDGSGTQQFFIRYTGDDITENLSLREKLRQDHALVMPELGDQEDEELDIESYFSAVQKIIKPRPGFALPRRVSLCMLSFTNMLLVRDLDPENWPVLGGKNALLDHSIVRRVLEGRDSNNEAAATALEDHQIEEEPAKSMPLIFDADSSQHNAIVDVIAKRRNLVIEGPPGTGKSQTITNLIAASLAKGQRVLFVSEKLAALQVVKNRLSLAGLDPFLLELHSTRTSKKAVLDQIAARLDHRAPPPRALPQKLEELEGYRKELKGYADLLNSVMSNRFGMTVHEVMWRAETYRQKLSVGEAKLTQTDIADAAEITKSELTRRMDALQHLGAQHAAIGRFGPEHPFWGFWPSPLVPGDELRVAQLFSELQRRGQDLVSTTDSLARMLGEDLHIPFEELLRIRDVIAGVTERLDERLPLHLALQFLEPDSTGRVARIQLEKLSALARRSESLGDTVMSGIISEEQATEESLNALRDLLGEIRATGARAATVSEIQQFVSELRTQIELISSAIQVIRGFCTHRGIPFIGSTQELELLNRAADAILELSEDCLDVHDPKLANKGCGPALENLEATQTRWHSIESELSEQLYLDNLPAIADLKQAIITLRHGYRWYLLFDARWFGAISLHKDLQRAKKSANAECRLADLHRLADLMELKQRWKKEPAWQLYLSRSAPDEPFDFAPYLHMAKWCQAALRVEEDLGAQFVQPATLSPREARQLKRDVLSLKKEIGTALAGLAKLTEMLPARSGAADAIQTLTSLAATTASNLERHLPRFSGNSRSGASLTQAIASQEAALERRQIAQQIESDHLLKELLQDQYSGIQTDAEQMLRVVAIAETIAGLEIPEVVRKFILSGKPLQSTRELTAAMDACMLEFREIESVSGKLLAFGDFNLNRWVEAEPAGGIKSFSKRLLERAVTSTQSNDSLMPWSAYVSRRGESHELGLSEFVSCLERGELLSAELSNAYAYATFSTIAREVFRKSPKLGRFSGLKHTQIRNEFKRLDREIIRLRGADVAAKCVRDADPPYGSNGARVNDKTEMVLVRYLLPQQRPRIPVRKLLKRAGAAIQATMPCFMMGPQAVAQYLSPGATSFDLIIMDEASQLKPEEAIGAVARGAQLVVVGDPKQLPPTTFFNRMSQAGDDEDQFTATDAKSILDVCLGQFHPARGLRWHYRSQHHSLIAFSNHYFYRNNLIIFPSPYGHSAKLGIRATFLADAKYEDQTNYKEALRVVDAAVEHVKTRPEESLGIVTLNLKQRDLIAELLEERLGGVSEADAYRQRWSNEAQPLFVKNLENVQGDERDAIIISITFGKSTGSDAVRQNFGPISREGGWRRLNVLFTRARKSIALFTSMTPEDIVLDASTPDGTKALRNYLEYARTGMLPAEDQASAEPESDFEIAVINVLRSNGYEVTPQLGVAGYRIDIAVKHPEFRGVYLAAIECDGAGYHSALSVRDRDRIRQEVLESMGWRGRIWRIWSTDWFRMPRAETEKLLSFLGDLRNNWKPEYSSGQSWVEIGRDRDGDTVSITNHVAAVRSSLFEFEEEGAVQVGDTVQYVDVRKPDDVLTVQITQDKTDTSNGFVHRGTPLAQTLLGALKGEEVVMHLPSTAARTFRILDVKRTAP